jgi:hypothetical protein
LIGGAAGGGGRGEDPCIHCLCMRVHIAISEPFVLILRYMWCGFRTFSDYYITQVTVETIIEAAGREGLIEEGGDSLLGNVIQVRTDVMRSEGLTRAS